MSFGVAVQIGFACTIPLLYWFLLAGASALPAPGAAPLSGTLGWWSDALVDLALVAAFAVPHSIFLAPRVRARLERAIPPPLYGSFFCATAIAGLLALFGLWRPLPGVLYALDGVARTGMVVANALSWLALVYSMWLGGLGYQTGLTSLGHYVRRERPPRRTFEPRGAYLLFRHPIYFSFILMAWTTPVMTTGHLLLSLAFLVYSLVGSVLKDRRLAGYLGPSYRRYMTEVPAYPLWPVGALARVE